MGKVKPGILRSADDNRSVGFRDPIMRAVAAINEKINNNIQLSMCIVDTANLRAATYVSSAGIANHCCRDLLLLFNQCRHIIEYGKDYSRVLLCNFYFF